MAHRFTQLLVLGIGLHAGCIGEAAVSYEGAVVEGTASSYSFDATPATGTPVTGARVELCIDDCCSDSVTTNDTGAYREIEQGFGGFLGASTRIEVRVFAPDGRTTRYATVFEDTSDPTLTCTDREDCEPVYLNFVLARPD